MSATSTKAALIQSELRRQILDQTWKIGDRLPSDGDLAKRFDCSVATASKAVSLLAHDGLVERRPRAGTRIISTSTSRGASQLDSFAFIYPSDQHEGIWRTVRGFQEAANARQRRVMMFSTGTDYAKEAEHLARLSEFDVRGAVIYPLVPTQNDQIHFSQMLMASKIPIVLAELNLPGMPCSSVVIDGFHAGYTMTRHLIEKGLSKIGFFSNYAWAPFMRDRYLGYRWALQESGITEDEKLILIEPSMHPDFGDPLKEVTELARSYLRCNKGLKGVVCANDFLAHALVIVAREEGIKVPAELKVTGIDDFALHPPGSTALTTYQIPYEEMGMRAFEALSTAVENKHSPPKETMIQGRIIIREST